MKTTMQTTGVAFLLMVCSAAGTGDLKDDGDLDALAANIEGISSATTSLDNTAAVAVPADVSSGDENSVSNISSATEVVPLAVDEPAESEKSSEASQAATPVDATPAAVQVAAQALATTYAGAMPEPQDAEGKKESATLTMPPSLRGSATKFLAISADAEGQKEDQGAEEVQRYIESRLEKVSSEDSFLREQLREALRWGTGLRDALQQQTKASSDEKELIRQALRKREQEQSAKMTTARQHEHLLETVLVNVSHALKVRTEALEHLQEDFLEKNRSFETSQTSFLATIKQLKTDQGSEQLQVSKQEEQLRQLREASAADKEELTHARKEFDHDMSVARKEVHDLRETEQALHLQLQQEHLREKLVQKSLKNATRLASSRGRSLLKVHRELQDVNSTYEASKRSWQATESEMRHDQAALEQQVTTQENNLRWLRAAKASEESELNTTRAQFEKEQRLARDTLEKETTQGTGLRQALEKERTSSGANERMFKEELTRQVRRAQKEKTAKEMLKNQLAELQNFSHLELGKLAAQLQVERHREDDLRRERSALRDELDSNASKVANLSAEVAMAYSHLDKDDAERKNAEDTSKKAQADMRAAQAVARQLSGTVPKLLEQENIAHEQEEAEKAMRTQAQAKAKKQIDSLEQQYTTLVQGQIDQLVPKDSSGSGDAVDQGAVTQDLAAVPADTGDATPVAATKPTVAAIEDAVDGSSEADQGDDVKEVVAEAVAKERSPDLASDSKGLKQLLGQDSAGADE